MRKSLDVQTASNLIGLRRFSVSSWTIFMRLMLCHECWSWVTPAGVNCPDCHHFIDITGADPSVARLALEFGDFVARIAVVRIDRRRLPATGTLVGTTRGLLFFPFLEPLPDGGLRPAASTPSSSRFWSLWNFWQPRPFPTGRLLAEASLPLPEEPDLATLFLDTPGSQFLPREQILKIHARGNRWSLSRARGSSLKVNFLSSADEWLPAWRQLLASSQDWESLA